MKMFDDQPNRHRKIECTVNSFIALKSHSDLNTMHDQKRVKSKNPILIATNNIKAQVLEMGYTDAK